MREGRQILTNKNSVEISDDVRYTHKQKSLLSVYMCGPGVSDERFQSVGLLL